jgi:hypothetical protein
MSRVIIIPPKLPHLDLRNVNKEKQQRAKQLPDCRSVPTGGLRVQYQVVMKRLTRYVHLFHDLDIANEPVYRCIQRARVMRRMYVWTILCLQCHRWTGVS